MIAERGDAHRWQFSPKAVTSSPVTTHLTPREALLSYSFKESTVILDQPMRVAPIMFAIIVAVAAHGQQGRWAAADNATAKFMLDAERQWAEAACEVLPKIRTGL